MTSLSFKTLHVWDTKFSADSVEWCPLPPYQNYFACGTYFLEEHTDTSSESEKRPGYQRIGNVTIFAISENKLEKIHSVECPAVLDMKWAGVKLNENIALASANAEGEISLYYFKDNCLNFVSKYVFKSEPGDYLILSLDWVKNSNSDLLCSSDSKGNVALLKVTNSGLEMLKKWKAHSLESWIVCFDSFKSNIIYSGGDEAEMKIWDSRCEDILKIASSNKHTAGVTALNSNIHKENILVSGSYDETVLFWDSRNWKSFVGNITASGGLWRLKWDPHQRTRYLLAACIYGGFQIYDVNSYSVVADYKEHESLAYGADWSYLKGSDLKEVLNCEETSLIATCSFYDHKLCVSLWNESLT